MSPRINISSFSRRELGPPLLKLPMPSATTTLINLTPAPRGRKIVCKHVLFFDFYWGPPPPCKQALNYSAIIATEQNTECMHEVHAQASIFLRQLHVSNILCVRRFYLAHAHVFTTTFIVTCTFL